MNLEEAIDSDDIEIARLAADILRKQKGKSYVANLIRKHGKYEFKKGEGSVSKFKSWGSLFNKFKMINTPLLSMTEIKNTVIYTNEDVGIITFNLPYKIDKNGKI